MQAVHPIRTENFYVNHGGECRCARQAHKRVDNLRFSPSCTLKRLYYWALSRFFERRTPMLHLFAT